jgi:two-component system, NarL family, nitrate/nitrite response regulator NarL
MSVFPAFQFSPSPHGDLQDRSGPVGSSSSFRRCRSHPNILISMELGINYYSEVLPPASLFRGYALHLLLPRGGVMKIGKPVDDASTAVRGTPLLAVQPAHTVVADSKRMAERPVQRVSCVPDDLSDRSSDVERTAGNVIRMMLVDAQSIVREGVSMLIGSRQNMKVVGQAANRSEALTIARRELPDIVLLDLDLGNESALDFLDELLEIDECLRVLILTAQRDLLRQRQAIEMGAMGIVMKEQTPETLIRAIQKVYAGELWLDRTTTMNVMTAMRRDARAAKSDLVKIGALTQREQEIAALVGQGLATRELSTRLFISEKTVRNHLAAIYRKLDVCGRLELALFSLSHGLGDARDRHPAIRLVNNKTKSKPEHTAWPRGYAPNST